MTKSSPKEIPRKKMSRTKQISLQQLPKTLTGINGLEEITYGGFPKGRPTLLCGGAGAGKTPFAMEFLVHGADDNEKLRPVYFSCLSLGKELGLEVEAEGVEDQADGISKTECVIAHGYFYFHADAC
jgi:RecA/RadA recombinase